MVVPKGDKQRRLHKALLRYHDPANWPLIRQALEAMGKKHLIGGRRECLVPAPTIGRDARSASPEPQHPPGVDQTYASGAPATGACRQ
nr:putative Fe-S oxidoreductase family 2 [Salmonella sp. NCTC 7297]